MMRWIAGGVAGVVGLLGLFWSASAGSGETGYVLGMLIAVAALIVLFVLIKTHYDAVDRAGGAGPGEGTTALGGRGAGDNPGSSGGGLSAGLPSVPALGLLPANPWDNMVIALMAGILSLGGGIVATYNTGLGWAFGMLMFFGFGAIVLAAGIKIWTVGFIEDDDRRDA